MSQPRTCIKCGHEMLPEMVQEVEVDVCPNCGGLWLDAEEIRLLSAKSEAELASLKKIIQEIEPDSPGRTESTDFHCPACDERLTLAVLGPIRVEHCPSCDGMYLDKGELDRAIEVLRLRGRNIATIVAMARSVFVSGDI